MITNRTIYKTEAIVLSALDYGESDRIVSFYSADFGKIKGIAKGAKKSRHRFVNVLEPFTNVSLLFSQRHMGTLAFIEGCSVLEHYASLRADLFSSLLASYLVELVDRFTLEGKQGLDLFALLSKFLLLLTNANGDGERFVRIFEMKFLRLMGYAPQLDRCVKCQMPIEENNNALQFDPIGGGVRCPHCQEEDTPLLLCSAGALKTIALGVKIDIDKVEHLFFSAAIAQECERVLAAFIRHLLGRELRSREVLRQVKRLQSWG